MKTLGKYELLEVLRTGSMGVIYRARDPVLEREVAVKAISTAAIDPESKERFYREARSCARLQHPHIVTIYDLGEQGDTAYIAMELLSGLDLRRLMAEKRPISLETKLELMAEVCEGLGHAHRNGIVHRDVKPGNIFVQDDGRAKVLDFGIARLPSSQLTRIGSALGTPEYMAPEQIAGRPCEARSDLFSVAIVLFEFLVHRHPFGGANSAGRIVNGAPESLRSLNPLLPSSLDQVLATGLSKAFEGRFQSAEAFAAALRSVKEEAGRTALAARNKAESLRRVVLSGRTKLGQFEQCRKVQDVLAQAESDWKALEAAEVAEAGCLEWQELGAQLQTLRQKQEKALDLTRESRERLRSIRGLLKDGKVEGASELLETVEADFPDHPQLATLRKKITRTPASRKAPVTAAPEPAEPVESRTADTLQRLLHALDEHDPAVMTEAADQLRFLLRETGFPDPEVLSRGRQALLAADFEMARTGITERIESGDVPAAEEAFRQLENLPLKEPPHLEAREHCRRQLEEARRNQDLTERRASEFHQRLEEFNAAVEGRDAARARTNLEEMRRLAAENEQFGTTLAECEKRLQNLQSVGKAPEAPAVSPILAALRQRTEQLFEHQEYEQCVAFVDSLGRTHQADPAIAAQKRHALEELAQRHNPPEPTPPTRPMRSTPPSPFELPGQTSRPAHPPLPSLAPAADVSVPPEPPSPPAATPAEQPVAVPQPEPAAAEAGAEVPIVEIPAPARVAPPPLAPLPTLRIPAARGAGLTKGQRTIIGALASVVIVVSAVVLFLVGAKKQRVPLAAAQASAEVAAREARILAAPDQGARALVTVHKGDRVNVVRVPAARNTEWIEAQFVTGARVFPPGYLKVAEVGNWRSEDPETAVQLLKLFGPDPSAPDSEIRQQIGRLTEFTSRFAITPQGPRANFEMANWNLVLARRARERGQPTETWQSYLDAATGQLAMAAVAADLAGPIAHARQELEALKEVERSRAPARPQVITARRPDAELKRAQDAWRKGRYRDSLRTLDRLLRDRPGYTPALALREKVRRAQQLESRTR